MKRLYGTGVALITPFKENGEIDFKSLKKLLNHTAKGVDYYVVLGTTGEAATLTREEKAEVLEFVKSNNPLKLPIVYGIGGNNTREVVDAMSKTDLNGVDALLSVSPYYNKPSQEGIFQHFKAIAEAAPIPVILYNVPGRTASNITAETTLRLAELRGIMGIKEASGSVEQCMRIARDKPRDFLLISGDDLFAAPLYAMGGVGVISVLANAYPAVFRKMKELSFSGSHDKAHKEALRLLDINPLMYEESNPVGLKALLEDMGICTAHVRLPLVEASQSLRKRITAVRQEKNKG